MIQPNNIYLGDSKMYANEIAKIENAVIVVDPPFNIGYHYNNYKDNLEINEYWNMVIKNVGGGNLPIVMVHYPEQLHEFSKRINKTPTRVVSWVYNSNTPRQHRDIAFYDIKPNFNQIKQPYKNINDKRIQQRIKDGKTGARLYDWWNINQVKNVSKEKTKHPCQMPLEVMKNIVGILPKDSIVVDTFMGSGTTCLACKELGIKYIGFEVNEEYFNIAKDRLNNINARGEVSLW